MVGLPFHCSWWLGKAGFFYRAMKRDFISGLHAGPTRGPGAATKAFSSPWRGLGKVGCCLPAHRLCLEVSAPLGLYHHHLGALTPAGDSLSVGISSSRFILIITTEASFIPHFSDYLFCSPCLLTSLCSAATYQPRSQPLCWRLFPLWNIFLQMLHPSTLFLRCLLLKRAYICQPLLSCLSFPGPCQQSQQSPNFFYSLPSPLPQYLSSYPLTGTLFLPPLEHKIHENRMSFFFLTVSPISGQ